VFSISRRVKEAIEKCIIITGDGDFGCLVEFTRDNQALYSVIAPDENKCSILIRNKNNKSFWA
jgi:hypothetical protein